MTGQALERGDLAHIALDMQADITLHMSVLVILQGDDGDFARFMATEDGRGNVRNARILLQGLPAYAERLEERLQEVREAEQIIRTSIALTTVGGRAQ